jgi:hypothetical protein
MKADDRNGLPCEICCADGDCPCKPCGCVWCRHRRGECTDDERRMIEARDRAFAAADLRADLRRRLAARGNA